MGNYAPTLMYSTVYLHHLDLPCLAMTRLVQMVHLVHFQVKVYLAYVGGLKEKEVEGRDRVHSVSEASQVWKF